MNKRKQYVSLFLFLTGISIVLVFVFHTGELRGEIGIFEDVTTKANSAIFSLSRIESSSVQQKISLEKDNIQSLLLKENILEQDNTALRDQFQSNPISASKLIPAHIIGIPHFLPGNNDIETLILDKGRKDGIVAGQAVVVKNILIGKIRSVSEDISAVTTSTSTRMSLNAKVIRSNALGIVDGDGAGNLILSNVLLSDDIKVGDEVVTYGGIDENGKGILPNLLIGVIVSVDKKPSALFQAASVKDAIDVSRLSIVFVMAPKK